ncbi:MAG: SRPBCC domain-containing protein [Pseudomonadota bacterium]
MKTHSTSIQINASPKRVWSVLTEDLKRDPEPFGIPRIEGAIAPGSRIKLWSEVDPKRAFALKVTVLEAPSRMIWHGGMPFGLFVGTRTFLLTPAMGGCTFEMREVFSGVLSGLITKSIPDLTPSFEKFANTLKEKAENNA